VTLLNIKTYTNSFVAISGCALFGLLFATNADAQTTQNVAVEVTFVAAVTVAVPTNELQFGLIDVLMPVGETLTIAPDNALSGDTANSVGGTQGSADLDVTATAGVNINILVDNVSIPVGSDYTLGAWICDYNNGADLTCDGGGMSETSAASAVLRVGVTLTALGTASAGNQDATFDVTVTYQ
jgi:hypothetical protein